MFRLPQRSSDKSDDVTYGSQKVHVASRPLLKLTLLATLSECTDMRHESFLLHESWEPFWEHIHFGPERNLRPLAESSATVVRGDAVSVPCFTTGKGAEKQEDYGDPEQTNVC